MTCIDKIYSVSAVVGTGICNGNCKFCAGKFLWKEGDKVPSKYWKNLESAIKLSARYGGWSLSLTGSGEPTCEPIMVSNALSIYRNCAEQGAYFPNVNIFTNGILLGDDRFCNQWLPDWRSLGLTNMVISIHSVDLHTQAETYGIKEYPEFQKIFDNVRRHGIGVRCTLLLRKGEIDTANKYHRAVNTLAKMGVDNITSWPVGNPDGSRNEYTPSWLQLMSIRWWLKRNAQLCHGHVWGGGVYDWHGNILRITDYVTRHNPKKDFVRQLVVFQDGTVAYSWIREGALCMK
jgi:sulfatase maturation enzyme AslB (radical SAM superfamily)